MTLGKGCVGHGDRKLKEGGVMNGCERVMHWRDTVGRLVGRDCCSRWGEWWPEVKKIFESETPRATLPASNGTSDYQ